MIEHSVTQAQSGDRSGDPERSRNQRCVRQSRVEGESGGDMLDQVDRLAEGRILQRSSCPSRVPGTAMGADRL